MQRIYGSPGTKAWYNHRTEKRFDSHPCLSLKERMQLFTQALLTVLVQFHNLTGNLGFAILLFTFVVRSLLLPLSLPSIKAQKKIKELKPHLDALKSKHGSDKKALQVAQMELYKKHNVNPLNGCLPQIVQIGLLFLLYPILSNFVTQGQVNGVLINAKFFWLDLSKPDPIYILPILAVVTQLIMSVMILPGGETPDIIPNDSKKKAIKEANKKEEDMADMAATMQKQMLFLMPLTTGFIALKLSSGLALYWVATTVFSIFQQYFLSGPGGLTIYTTRIKDYISSRILHPKTK